MLLLVASYRLKAYASHLFKVYHYLPCPYNTQLFVTFLYLTCRTVRQIFSPIFLSATEDGRIRRGLPKLTEGKPLLFVGNHTFIGFDLGMIVDEFLKNKGILLRGLAHPVMSIENQDLQEPGGGDLFRLFGTVPVNGNNLYRLLSRGEAALLYPGGVREALKRKVRW